jgi:hypothetical protein
MNLVIGNDGGYLLAILIGLLIAFGLPIILAIIGIAIRNKNKKASKILLISAVVYTLIGLGICGSLMI